MRYRKLRIAWTVAWAVVAALLCVLWIRSYRGDRDECRGLDILCCSRQGKIIIVKPKPVMRLEEAPGAIRHSYLMDREVDLDVQLHEGSFGFYSRWQSKSAWLLQLPYWFIMAVFVTFASIRGSIKADGDSACARY